MNIAGVALICLGIGWLIGFIHRGAMYAEEERQRKWRVEKMNRDHLDLGPPHYKY